MVKNLNELWNELSDIPVDKDAIYIESNFMHFESGTEIEDIWHWIEDEYNISIGKEFF